MFYVNYRILFQNIYHGLTHIACISRLQKSFVSLLMAFSGNKADHISASAS